MRGNNRLKDYRYDVNTSNMKNEKYNLIYFQMVNMICK